MALTAQNPHDVVTIAYNNIAKRTIGAVMMPLLLEIALGKDELEFRNAHGVYMIDILTSCETVFMFHVSDKQPSKQKDLPERAHDLIQCINGTG